MNKKKVILIILPIICLVTAVCLLMSKKIDKNTKMNENTKMDLNAKAYNYVAEKYSYTTENYDINVEKNDDIFKIEVMDKGTKNIIKNFEISASKLKKWKQNTESPESNIKYEDSTSFTYSIN